MQAAEFYRPETEPWGIVWRLFVSPWPPLWLLLFDFGDLRRETLWHLLEAVFPRSLVVGILLGLGAIALGYPCYVLFKRLQWTNPLLFVLGGALVAPLAGGVVTFALLLDPALSLAVPSQFLVHFMGGGAAAALVFWSLLRIRRWRPRATSQ